MLRCMLAIMFAKLLALNHTSMSLMANNAIVDIEEPEFCRVYHTLWILGTKMGERKCKTSEVSKESR